MPPNRSPSGVPGTAPRRDYRGDPPPSDTPQRSKPRWKPSATRAPILTTHRSSTPSPPSLHGSVVLPGTPEYEEARLVHNANTDRRPAVIVRPADASDVARTVRFARETGRRLSVRGGGHSLAGYGTNDGGIVLDLSPMKGSPHRRRCDASHGRSRA